MGRPASVRLGLGFWRRRWDGLSVGLGGWGSVRLGLTYWGCSGVRVGLDRDGVALSGSWGALVISAATFPLFLGQNDGKVAVLMRGLLIVDLLAGVPVEELPGFVF